MGNGSKRGKPRLVRCVLSSSKRGKAIKMGNGSKIGKIWVITVPY